MNVCESSQEPNQIHLFYLRLNFIYIHFLPPALFYYNIYVPIVHSNLSTSIIISYVVMVFLKLILYLN